MAHADAWLGKYRAFWAARLQALKLMIEAEDPTPEPPDEKE